MDALGLHPARPHPPPARRRPDRRLFRRPCSWCKNSRLTGYQPHFQEQIRREARIPTGAVGMIIEPAQADHILRTGQADLVFLAREFLRDPYWALHAAQHLRQKISWPVQYLRGAGTDVPSREPVSAEEAESLRIS